MPLFWKKEQQILNKIRSLLESVDKCRDLFESAMIDMIQNGHSPKSEEAVARVHDAESRTDDILREIEHHLYERALIPESRGDVLGILETFEKIPDHFEHSAYFLSLQLIEIPDPHKESMVELIRINISAYNEIRDAVLEMFYERDVTDLIDSVDKIESRSDQLERELIRGIFLMDIDKGDKILLRQMIERIGDISDQAQKVTDRLALAVIKRRI